MLSIQITYTPEAPELKKLRKKCFFYLATSGCIMKNQINRMSDVTYVSRTCLKTTDFLKLRHTYSGFIFLVNPELADIR